MKSKKFLAALLAIFQLLPLASTTACKTKDATYVAKAIVSEEEPEHYAFAIGKNASKKTEILTAMNKVIEEVQTELSDIVDYYKELSEGKKPSVPVVLPNLLDNTAGVLNVYTNAEFPPFEFFNDDKKIVGVDVYLMGLVAEELDMQLKLTDVEFDSIVERIQTEDNAIGAAGITITKERREKVDFSNSYYSTTQCIVSTEEESFDSVESLKGKKIGVQKGTTGWKLVAEAIEKGVLKDSGATAIPYPSGALAFAAQKEGECDVVVIDRLLAEQLVK